MRKKHLKLIVSNSQTNENFVDRFWKWFTAPRKLPFVMTYEEKREQVIKYLTLKFADYQLTTGEVGLFPLNAAINEVEKLERNNQLERYYNRNKRRFAL